MFFFAVQSTQCRREWRRTNNISIKVLISSLFFSNKRIDEMRESEEKWVKKKLYNFLYVNLLSIETDEWANERKERRKHTVNASKWPTWAGFSAHRLEKWVTNAREPRRRGEDDNENNEKSSLDVANFRGGGEWDSSFPLCNLKDK